MELVNFAGLFLLSLVAASLLSFASMDAFKGLSVPKGFFVWFILLILTFLLSIIVWIGVKLVVM